MANEKLTITDKEKLQQLDELFHKLYETTANNCMVLKEDKKDYETPKPGEDEEMCFVPYFVTKFLKVQYELMAEISDKYIKLKD